MDNAMIGKIEKAKRYAQELDRIKFQTFEVTIRGENNTHTVHYTQGKFTCECSFFGSRSYCSHTMAMERVLGEMIEKPVTAEA